MSDKQWMKLMKDMLKSPSGKSPGVGSEDDHLPVGQSEDDLGCSTMDSCNTSFSSTQQDTVKVQSTKSTSNSGDFFVILKMI